MELASLHELYVEGLRDLYSAEHQILKALPKLHKAATNPKVKEAFATHLAQTEEQVIAGLISSAQHVEHYEMAGYGTVRTYAQLLGFPKQAELLQQTLDEEQATDLLLTEIALSVNVDAIVADGETADELR